ncbi:hypothetical protein Q6348_08440 [Isoptericola sp. b441]|uniref:Uncharacterized protein n=1 Tax=Actinotalea lenta TaxID=3064654 RepID=A0ABT9D8L2_9CELL|nr:hypothetical protein [Isoptericola sp. b441]MDO8107221.1 hypothetical protein [Isoptericola sp. b441]
MTARPEPGAGRARTPTPRRRDADAGGATDRELRRFALLVRLEALRHAPMPTARRYPSSPRPPRSRRRLR